MIFLEGEFSFEFLQVTSCSATSSLLFLYWGRESTWSALQSFTGKKLQGSCWVINFVFRLLSLQILIVLSESFLTFF